MSYSRTHFANDNSWSTKGKERVNGNEILTGVVFFLLFFVNAFFLAFWSLTGEFVWGPAHTVPVETDDLGENRGTLETILRRTNLPVGRDDPEEADVTSTKGQSWWRPCYPQGQRERDDFVIFCPQHEDPGESVRQRQPRHQQVGRLPGLALADHRVQHQAVQQQDEGRQDELKQERSCQFSGGPLYRAPGRSAPGWRSPRWSETGEVVLIPWPTIVSSTRPLRTRMKVAKMTWKRRDHVNSLADHTESVTKRRMRMKIFSSSVLCTRCC